QPQLLKEAELNAETLIVFPEALRVSSYHRSAMWWLSVDGALSTDPKLNDEAYRRDFFADDNRIYFYQSDYARDYLERAGAKKYFPLTDYTDPLFIDY
ncbi:hypothetical protein ACSTI4_23660, partial [Vibrio parahaemolyticus]